MKNFSKLDYISLGLRAESGVLTIWLGKWKIRTQLAKKSWAFRKTIHLHPNYDLLIMNNRKSRVKKTFFSRRFIADQQINNNQVTLDLVVGGIQETRIASCMTILSRYKHGFWTEIDRHVRLSLFTPIDDVFHITIKVLDDKLTVDEVIQIWAAREFKTLNTSYIIR